ncbi:MAG: hypothetical protein JWR10_3606 [Rubritepida sp.]|nr:hypothetical protein [Rubritepida sp.]
MSGYQLTSPPLGPSRKAKPRLGDFTLRFDPDLLFQAQQQWFGLPSLNATPMLLGPLFGGLDSDLARTLGSFSQKLRPQATAPQTVSLIAGLLDESLKRKIAEGIRDGLSRKVTAPGSTNVATDKPVTIGNLNSDGSPAYDGVDKVVPGIILPLSKGLGLLGLGKTFKFNAIRDVNVGLIFDKDAALSGRFGLLLSGASIEVPFTAPGGGSGKLLVIGGRDQAGGAAGSISIGFALP